MAKSRVTAIPREDIAPLQPEPWSAERSSELYRLDAWGEGFFFINEHGHAAVRPFPENDLAIDIVQVVAEIRRRNAGFPVLIRFQDVLEGPSADGSTRHSPLQYWKPAMATSIAACIPSRSTSSTR